MGTLGDHTFTHADLPGLAPAQVESELATNQRLIERASGQTVDLFRPPYGAQDAAVNRIARRLGLLDIMWSMDSRDSLGGNWAGIIQNVKADLRPGRSSSCTRTAARRSGRSPPSSRSCTRRHLRSVSLPELFATDPPSAARVRGGLTACLGYKPSPSALSGAH